jgi:hypothetical protein
MQLQRTRPDLSKTEQVHHLLTQIKKHLWLGLDAEAEKLAAELARLQPGATKIEPPDTD